MIESSKHPELLHCRCCVVGGGPAGMMLGFLLARAGVDVIVLEKHADFLRDFRGDTIHPSTLQVMVELGLLEDFLRRPHQELSELGILFGDERVTVADFSHLPTRCKFIAFMPQWDFLDFLAERAKAYANFRLIRRADASAVIRDDGRVVGVEATTPDGTMRVLCDLVVGADGRSSTVRASAGLEVMDVGAPIDVLWMRVSKKSSDPGQTLGRVRAGRIFIMLDRGEYWQCAYVIVKGGADAIRARGLPAFREDIVRLAPFLRDRVDELRNWDDIKVLDVRVDRLRRWSSPGLLCIGDAAHAMSPVGGVGINLAIQDAVAAANRLAEPLRAGPPAITDLEAVQKRRELPTRLTQRVQVFLQNRVISRVLAEDASRPPRRTLPLVFRLLRHWPRLRRIPARMIGIGFRPEHVRCVNSESPESPESPNE